MKTSILIALILSMFGTAAFAQSGTAGYVPAQRVCHHAHCHWLPERAFTPAEEMQWCGEHVGECAPDGRRFGIAEHAKWCRKHHDHSGYESACDPLKWCREHAAECPTCQGERGAAICAPNG